MSKIIDDTTKKEVLSVFTRLTRPVELIFFTQKNACPACREQERLLGEVAVLSDTITLSVKDLLDDAELVEKYGISKVPATVITAEKDYGIRFYGLTSGYEFGSLLESIVMVSTGSSGLSPEIEKLLQLIDEPVHLEVMVTLTCPYCPKMVHVAHQFAVAAENIRSDMIESSEFPTLVQRYDVSGVPKTVINEGPSFEGALPDINVVMEILKAVKPREYDRIDAQMREASGERFAFPAVSDRLYDVIIVGAGPAALSAAVYASRKSLDVALIGEHLGGQITNTATIENWLGIPSISGTELAALFRNHAESYPVAEQLEARVESVTKAEDTFLIGTTTGTEFRARCIIYCAGKEYKRLGVPGESRFIGRGIAFCATCDAPLYRDKRVAVIGGGNSAFTAARDLIPYAREIHIVNILDDFQADPILQDEVKNASQVSLHPGMHVLEFLGKETLVGVRLNSADGHERRDIAVEGVFLEIGLVPNTHPAKGLITLNDAGEIPVRRDQSTEVPGFFAAGDVTDEPEKQIVVAAGAGAKAALSAWTYLLNSGIRALKE
ncbi:MAG: protein disulfide oxidoreductase [Desulfomonilia bacterium]